MEYPAKEHNVQKCPASYRYFRKIKAVQDRASQARVLRQLLSTDGLFAALDDAKDAEDMFAVHAVHKLALEHYNGDLDRELMLDNVKM